ncbi:MAG: PaaI family thioesterase [Pseudomonadota bacterium]
MTPANPDFETRTRDSFARQTFMETIGICITRVAPGMFDTQMDFAHAYQQQHGFLHGGVVSTGLDSVCGFCALTLVAADAGVLTVENKTSFLAPANGQSFRFEGRVIKPGRTLIFCQAKAFAIMADAEKLCATMTSTVMCVEGREDVKG